MLEEARAGVAVVSGVDSISGGTHAPTPRAMTEDEAAEVSRFLRRHPGFTVAWVGDGAAVTADVTRTGSPRLVVRCHGWGNAAALGWGLERAPKAIEELEPDLPKPGQAIGVKFTQHTVKE